MLIFNPKRMFERRQIDKPHRELVKTGIAPSTATNLLNYHNFRVTVEHIEKICLALNCTPNDLFEWQSNENKPIPESHALNSLKPAEKPENLSELIKTIPVEKLSQIDEFVRGLRGGE